MTISQRKLMSSYNRATASDHRRAADDAQWAETRAVVIVGCILALGALLTVCGVL
jgi:hypothetical protein